MIRLASSERGTATSALNAEPSKTIMVLAPFIKRKLKWREPEKSIGIHLRSYGSNQCWQAIGPARKTFLQLGEEIKAHLEQCSEPLPTWVTWSIYMIGKTPAAAEPTVLFCSPDATHRKLIRKTIKRSGILDKYPGVGTGDMSQAPDFDQLVQLATENSDVPTMTILGIPTDHLAAIEVKGPTGETRRATVGGAVELSGRLFYMSVLHVLVRDSTPANVTDDSHSEYSFDGSETDDGDLNETSVVNLSAVDELLEASPGGPETRLRQVERECSSQETLQDITLPYACNILTRTGTHPGTFVFSPTDLDSIGLDYALLVRNDQVEFHGSSHLQWPALEPADAQYFLVDSHDVYMLRADGTRLIGTLGGAPAYTTFSGHTRFQLAYTINLESPLERGDSGAWVYDTESDDFVGILTAGCLLSNRAHIIPAYQVFRDLARESRKPGIQKLLQPASASPPPYSQLVHMEPGIKSEVYQASCLTADISSAVNDKIIEPRNALHASPLEHTPFTNSRWFEKWFKNYPTGTMDDAYVAWQAAKEHRMGGIPVEQYLSSPVIFPGGRAEMSDQLASAMTYSFRQLLSHSRLRYLFLHGGERTQPSFGSLETPLPSYDGPGILEVPTRRLGIKNLPVYPALPNGPREIEFRNMLWKMSSLPINWERANLLDQALQAVPLQKIYEKADEEAQIMKAEALSLSTTLATKKQAWGYQDCIIRVLMQWFKSSFFTWVNNPPCSDCGNPTQGIGLTTPTVDETALGASQVELYKCTYVLCGNFERFPRYNDAFVLMTTRRGRVDEWSNCFGMLCRAMGARVRWLWNSEGHVWLEIFSDHRERWVSVDVCEQTFDKPLRYTKGWERKLGYVIAFSAEGATDVTGRYVRNPMRWQAERSRITEPALAYVLQEITNHRRQKMSKDEVKKLADRDVSERMEIITYITADCTLDLCKTAFLPGGSSLRATFTRPDVQDFGDNKAAEAREGTHSPAENRSGRVRYLRRPGDNGAGNGGNSR